MKVYTKPLDAYLRTSVVGARAGRPAERSAVDASPSTAAEVSISAEARAMMAGAADASRGVDRAKVDSLRASVANGSFILNPMLVAERMLRGDR